MSAIFGIVDFNGWPLEDKWIRSMRSDLAHRGPDGQGLYREDSVALGHMLLQVTPESVYDTSPYEEDGLVITADARLDEREAVMDRLGIKGDERETVTDPLLLLRSFRKYGKDFVKDIYGDFAFAIWDKENRELFCARDQIGVKPFLYYLRDGRFVFSTELKAIVRLPFVDTEPDNGYLRNQVLYLYNKPGETNWKNVLRLKAAHMLVLANGRIRPEKYWDLIYRRSAVPVTAEESASALRNVIQKAVSDRLRTTGKVGIPLSGGLDSGSIACIAARELAGEGKRITTVSSVLGPGDRTTDETDEAEYINAIIAGETNIDPYFIPHTDLSFIDYVFPRFDRYYALFGSYNYVDEALFSQFHTGEVRRILHGYVGDQTVSNRTVRPLVHLFFGGRFRTFGELSRLYREKTGLSIWKVLKIEFLLPLTPPHLFSIWNRIRRRGSMRYVLATGNLPLNLSAREKRIITTLHRRFNKQYYRYKLKLVKNVWPDDNNYFREDWDCGSSHYQVEITYPLADRRVLEFLMTVPVEHFEADGLKRGLLRKAMDGILPDPVRERNGKGCYSPGYFQIIRKDLTKLIELIEQGPGKQKDATEYCNITKIRKELKNLINSKSLRSFTTNDWLLIEVSMWLLFILWNNNRILNTGTNAKENQTKVVEAENFRDHADTKNNGEHA